MERTAPDGWLLIPNEAGESIGLERKDGKTSIMWSTKEPGRIEIFVDGGDAHMQAWLDSNILRWVLECQRGTG